MRKHRKITSIEALVKAFGGTRELADWAGVGMSAISNWVDRGQIPPGWHYRLHLAAQSRGFEIEPYVFGVQHPEDAQPAVRTYRKEARAA